MPTLTPSTATELSELLARSAAASKAIIICGQNSKSSMAGPILPAEVTISTASLNRVLHYERDDLTVSVEAGMRFSALQDFLKAHGQMVALDPPFSDRCSVGGVLASASSGSLRRGFGTARDMVIGMTFATLDGRLVKTGGMVVKNVAGLDMGKLMIGSFGTLAVITSANFRVHPVPQQTRTYLFASQDLDGVLAKQHELRVSYLRPLAMDLLSPPAAARLEKQGFVLVVKAAGSRAVLDRYARELGDVESISGEVEEYCWKTINDYTPGFLERQPTGIVLRVSTPPSDLGALLRAAPGEAVSRSGAGVHYLYLNSWDRVPELWKLAVTRSWTVAVEHAPDEIRSTKDLWLQSADSGSLAGFVMMEKVKNMFDPAKLLNRSRLYGKI